MKYFYVIGWSFTVACFLISVLLIAMSPNNRIPIATRGEVISAIMLMVTILLVLFMALVHLGDWLFL